MKAFLAFFIRRPILTHFFGVLFVVGGIAALFAIKKEARPEIDFGIVVISTRYLGASPLDVERDVTDLIEEKIAEVDGIKHLYSQSLPNLSRIVAELYPGEEHRDIIDNLYRAVDQVKDLPPLAEKTEIVHFKAKDWPIIKVSIHGKEDRLTLHRLARRLERELELLPDLEQVVFDEKIDPIVEVKVKPETLAEKRLTVNEITAAIARWNVTGPAGRVENPTHSQSIRIDRDFRDLDRLRDLQLRANDTGKGILLKEVAEISEDMQESYVRHRFNGEPAVHLLVIRKEKADTLKAVEEVKKTVARFQNALPSGVSVSTFQDDSVEITNRLGIAGKNALSGLVLILILLFFTLNLRIALLTVTGFITAGCAAAALLFLCGQTLNIPLLLGVILVLGMLMDDSIVIGENIFYHLERGEDPIHASIEGTYEVFAPILGIVLTTIVAFIPLFYMSGMMGLFMKPIPAAVLILLGTSLIESLILMPSHCAHYLRLGKKQKERQYPLLKRLETAYAKGLSQILEHRYLSIGALLLFALGVMGLTSKALKVELFPIRGADFFYIALKGPPNTAVDESLRQTEKLEAILSKHQPALIESLASYVGTVRPEHPKTLFRGPPLAQVFAQLPSKAIANAENPLPLIHSIVADAKQALPPDWEISYNLQRFGPPIEGAVEISILGEDLKRMQTADLALQAILKRTPGITSVYDDLSQDDAEYEIDVDQALAMRLGVPLNELQFLLASAYEGIPTGQFRKDGEWVKIHVVYDKSSRQDLNALLKTPFKTASGQDIPLASFATLAEKKSPATILHRDRFRAITAYANLDIARTDIKRVYTHIADAFKKLQADFPDLHFRVGGEEEERLTAVQDTVRLLSIGAIAIYMIISLSLGSLSYPLIVLLAIPFGMMGAFVSLMAHGEVLSMAALTAIIGLSGVVVNDGILLMSFVLQNRRQGVPLREALLAGCERRFRPILLTVVSTVFGVLPAAYGMGGSDAFIRPMALVMGWGLLVSSLLTLTAMPAALLVVSEIVSWVKKERYGRV